MTQALHWGAFLLVMNMLLLSSVQQLFNAQTTALAIFTLLALGTFTAGIQVFSWQVCVLGAIMAIGVPAIAIIENSALLVTLIVVAVVGAGRRLLVELADAARACGMIVGQHRRLIVWCLQGAAWDGATRVGNSPRRIVLPSRAARITLAMQGCRNAVTRRAA